MRLKTFAKNDDRSWFKPFDCNVVALQREDPLKLQIAHFLNVVQGKTVPLVSALDGLQNLLVVDAISRAIASQQTIRLA